MTDKLSTIRQLLQSHQYDYYLVPSADAHNNEYTPEKWQRRAYISGFDGSAGEALIGTDEAHLWTDGRYFLQADNQLDSNYFNLQKQQGFASELEPWLIKHAANKTLGVDPSTISISRANSLIQTMKSIGGNCVFDQQNLIDQTKEQLKHNTTESISPFFIQFEKYSGQSVTEKLAFIRSQMKARGTQSLIVTVLDEIAWLLNIRGNDIPFNPLVISYLILTDTSCTFFVDTKKLTPETESYLTTNQINIEPYSALFQALSTCHSTVWLDKSTANYLVFLSLPDNADIFYERSPIVLAKACKNITELDGAKRAHKKDAVAVISFMHWLENNFEGQSEISAQEKLESFRQQQKHYKGPSFDTISGFASNGAIIHYRSTPETSKPLSDNALYLVDSGGQYLEGTTDITRTFHLGVPTEEERRHYTLVLKGHLAIQNSTFPEGTRGEQLDALARMALWQHALDYRHGTGHGVGSFLCVHEGPQRISPAPSAQALMPGMILSNEPGVYFDGNYGIRIENLCFVKQLQKQNGFGQFYQFEDLTLVPYEKKLIDITLLTNEEIRYINAYHVRVREELSSMISSPEIKTWLFERTQAI